MDKYNQEDAPLLANGAPEADLEQRDHRQMITERLKGLESKMGVASVQVKEI